MQKKMKEMNEKIAESDPLDAYQAGQQTLPSSGNTRCLSISVDK